MTDSTQLQTIDESGAPAKQRVRDAKSCWDLYQDRKTKMGEVSSKNAKIKGMVDGNRPYPEDELKRRGQSWRFNLNMREMTAIIREKNAAYWQLLMDVPELITVSILKKDIQDISDVDYAQVIAEEYTNLMFEWPAYFYHMILQSREMVTYGPSALIFPDETDWRFKYIPSGSILFGEQTRATVEEFRLVFVRDTISVKYCFDRFADPDGSLDEAEWREIQTNSGWNLPILKQALIDRYLTNKGDTDAEGKFQKEAWEALQQEVRNNDLYAAEMTINDLPVVRCLVQETSGKVSEYMVTDCGEEPKDFLFQKQERYEKMSNAIAPFFYDLGDGYVKSVRGVGWEVFPFVELSNRFICSIGDGATMAASLVLQPGAGGDLSDIRITRMGPITTISGDAKAVQSSFMPQFDQLIGVRSMMNQIMNNNLSVFRVRNEVADSNNKTAEQIRSEDQREARFENHQISLYYLQWDFLHKECIRRLLNPDYKDTDPGYEEARRFRAACESRGVPKELLKNDAIRVRSKRAIGLGSTTERRRISQEIVGLSSMFEDENGRRNAIRDRIASLTGYEHVDRYMPSETRLKMPTIHTTMATLENHDFAEGQTHPPGVDEMHVVHLQTHIADLSPKLKAAMEQPDPQIMQKFLVQAQAAIPHMRMHLDMMSRNPQRKAYIKEFMSLIDDLEKGARIIQGMLEKIAQQQQKEQQAQQQAQQAQIQQQANASAQQEMAVKFAELEKKFAIKNAEAEQQMRLREEKAQRQMTLKERQAEEAMRLAREKAEAEA